MRFCAVVLCSILCLVNVSAQDVSSLLSKSMFEQMLKHRNDAACPAKGFYTYEAFIAAARSFGAFGTTGDIDTRKREIAAFFGQTSHETNGGGENSPDGPYAWGYCFKEELGSSDRYRGRGPIQLTGSSNYDLAGRYLNYNLLNNPDLVANDPVVSFKTALWFWMTPQSPKPSAHAVMTGNWRPTQADYAAGRVPGYGVVTNIINGGVECGKGPNTSGKNRIGYYRQYCNFLGVSLGNNLGCASQKPFGS